MSTQSTYGEIAANGALALIAVAVPLLERQLRPQARAFEAEGGFTERLYRHRKARRDISWSFRPSQRHGWRGENHAQRFSRAKATALRNTASPPPSSGGSPETCHRLQ